MSDSEKRCRCGHDKGHYMVSVHRHYSAWGWFLALFMNAGATPRSLSWRCRRCGEVLDQSTDPEVLQANRA